MKAQIQNPAAVICRGRILLDMVNLNYILMYGFEGARHVDIASASGTGTITR